MTLVTIGMPVRNGGRMFEAALAGVLAQTHRELEVIVADNGSTDDTGAIAQAAAAADPRVRYVRHATPLSAFENFLFVLGQARGTYFAWAAHDDLRSADFVSGLLPAFADDRVVLAFGDLYLTARFGEPGHYHPYPFANDGRGRLARVRQQALMQCYHIYGLWRTAALQRAPKRFTPWWPDLPIMMAMAHEGLFVHRPGPRFVYLEVPKTDAERAAAQDGRADPGKLANVLGLLRCTWAVFREVAGPLTAAFATLCVAEKNARFAVIGLRRRLGVLRRGGVDSPAAPC